MQTEDVGTGPPEIAVVGLIHGDEPCGEDGIRAFLNDTPSLERPTRFIIANEEAREKGERYLDHDLNRVFPGDSTEDSHEKQLASELLDAVSECEFVLALHSTRSTGKPFAGFTNLTAEERRVVRKLPLAIAVDVTILNEGKFVQYDNVLEVECGKQQTDQAAENAEELIQAFLEATGALSTNDAVDEGAIDVFKLTEEVDKTNGKEFIAKNFHRVEEGDTYAISSDGPLTATDSFYPVLMSTDGYEDILGFKSDYKGTATGVRTPPK